MAPKQHWAKRLTESEWSARLSRKAREAYDSTARSSIAMTGVLVRTYRRAAVIGAAFGLLAGLLAALQSPSGLNWFHLAVTVVAFCALNLGGAYAYHHGVWDKYRDDRP